MLMPTPIPSAGSPNLTNSDGALRLATGPGRAVFIDNVALVAQSGFWSTSTGWKLHHQPTSPSSSIGSGPDARVASGNALVFDHPANWYAATTSRTIPISPIDGRVMNVGGCSSNAPVVMTPTRPVCSTRIVYPVGSRMSDALSGC